MQSLLQGYPGDSFHTLSPASANGLVIVSAMLVTLVLATSWAVSERWLVLGQGKSLAGNALLFGADLLTVLLVYALLLVLVPQVFYAYYQLVFSSLPMQWVIKPIPLQTFVNILALRPGDSTSNHFAGLTAWVLASNICIHWLLRKAKPQTPLPN